MEQQSLDTLKRVGSTLDLQNAIVHIVTIVEIKIYNLELAPFVYPSEDQYAEIESSAKMMMNSLATTLGLKQENIRIHCFFDSNRETRIKKYLIDEKADLVVSATRGKHGIDGFFSSSFTDYLCKFSPCDVLVMRPAVN
jgi:nucleotide-binding universal stress UspA family protein